MCPLIRSLHSRQALFVLIGFLVSSKVCISFAEISGAVTLSQSEQSLIQLNELSVPQSSQNLSIELKNLNELFKSPVGLNMTFGLNRIRQDFSNRNLTFKNGETIPLSRLDNGERNISQLGISISSGVHTISLNQRQDLKKTLFSERSNQLGYGISFYEGATQVLATATLSQSGQPFSYYADPGSLESKERPTQINSQNTTFEVQQIWNSRLKTRAFIGRKTTELFRPDELQVRLGTAFAFNQEFTIRNELGRAQEDIDQPLTLDRGYFQSTWFDTEVSYEWDLDSFLFFGLSLLDEVETDPRRDLTTGLGTDEIAIGVKQALKNFNYNLKASLAFNSEDQSATSFSGGLEWDF